MFGMNKRYRRWKQQQMKRGKKRKRKRNRQRINKNKGKLKASKSAANAMEKGADSEADHSTLPPSESAPAITVTPPDTAAATLSAPDTAQWNE